MKSKNNSTINHENKDFLNVNVHIINSYSGELYNYKDLKTEIVNENSFYLNGILDEVHQKSLNVENCIISFFDKDLDAYIHCGKYPLDTMIKLPIVEENFFKEDYIIKVKIRPIIKRELQIRMDLNEDQNENLDESNQNIFINVKSKRSKERKIGHIIEKVFLWRKLYNGFTDENGNHIKLTLEQSADKVGISKKSLDDYLIQLRTGKQKGFVFNEHKNDKVGVLRAFVKKQKYLDENRATMLSENLKGKKDDTDKVFDFIKDK